MSTFFPDGRALDDAEFLALVRTPQRVEMFDGSFYLAPALGLRHQHVCAKLLATLRVAADEADLYALPAVNVRLNPGLFMIPDLVIATSADFNQPVIEAAAIRLVCEVASPATSMIDKVLKRHHYATAGIPWYLLVDPEAGALHLLELDGTSYAKHSAAELGEFLQLTEPVVAAIDSTALLPPR